MNVPYNSLCPLCQALDLVWKAKNSCSLRAELFDSRCSGPCVSAVFTGSKRGSEVNTRFGSPSLGLRVEEIHLQYKLATSIVLGAHLAHVPSFFEPTSNTLLLCV